MNFTDCDIVVLSDGSGHVDGYGGWAALAMTPDGLVKTFRMGAICGTSVDRAEMTGMLEGLQMALEIWDEFPHFTGPPGSLVTPRRKNPKVMVISDRESMVLSSQGVYGRHSAEDLWARYAFYEARMTIAARHIDREDAVPGFQALDLHASTARILIQNYAKYFQFPSYRYNPTQHGLNTST